MATPSGLDHQDENLDEAGIGTCMVYTDDPSSNQHPHHHDYDQLVPSYCVSIPPPSSAPPCASDVGVVGLSTTLFYYARVVEASSAAR
ncbi:hypothetical protein MED01_005649 [Micromonospora sp. MED01]|uniref:hypothetical protein n=1 Tax=Micromonospora alfalfae TaxID=2911212 RepID=UPI001EE965E2|nr:hypothetical protein [Micromonospora alfalfae]MCG5466612.1 hypothetical protein [Micromonospora alfalfae]